MLSKSLRTSKLLILVHGAWHNNSCWVKLKPLLEMKGHTVYAPNLPGHHPREPISFKNISLKTYHDHIVKIILAAEQPVTLIGHSMAGVVISQVAENYPERISGLVYIAGFAPDNDRSLSEEAAKTEDSTVSKETIVDEEEKEIFFKSSDKLKDLFYNTCTNDDADWAVSQLQKQPLQPFLDKVSLSKERFGIVPKLYVECLKDNAISIENQRRMNSKLNCPIARLDSDHSPFLSMPSQLSELICAHT